MSSHGQFVKLSAGYTHYKIEGEGRPLVLVHGATVGLWEFDPIVPFLNELGFQTIRFDLFGHGISDRPRQQYSLQMFSRQLIDLMAALNLNETCLFIGHSMGAAIVASVLSLTDGPIQRESQAILVAPLLEHASKLSLTPWLKLPVFGRLLMETLGRKLLSRRRLKRLKLVGQEILIPKYIEQIRKPGYWRSLHGIICGGALENHVEIYRALGVSNHKLSLLWGDLDTIIPRQDIQTVRAFLHHADYLELPGLEHNLLLSHPRQLVETIVSIFRD